MQDTSLAIGASLRVLPYIPETLAGTERTPMQYCWTNLVRAAARQLPALYCVRLQPIAVGETIEGVVADIMTQAMGLTAPASSLPSNSSVDDKNDDDLIPC